jgi:hypothetical protein
MYELWAAWKRKCWKCGEKISVALNTEGRSFNPFKPYSEAWKKTKKPFAKIYTIT